MNWLSDILNEMKWKAQDFIWAIQDKIELWKINKSDEPFVGEIVEEIEVKPKKKSKKKSVKKIKKNF